MLLILVLHYFLILLCLIIFYNLESTKNCNNIKSNTNYNNKNGNHNSIGKYSEQLLILTWTFGYSTHPRSFYSVHIRPITHWIMNVTFIFFTQEKKFNAALDKLDVRQNTSLQVSILFVDLIAYIW